MSIAAEVTNLTYQKRYLSLIIAHLKRGSGDFVRSIDHAGRLDARFDARQLGLFILVQPKVNIWNQVRGDLISQPDSFG